MSGHLMDWAAVASILGERSERPLVLLDHDGCIRMFNRVMEQALGWRRFEVDGQPWATACTPPQFRDDARRWIDDALRGALWSTEARGLTKNGDHILFAFEFALVGRGECQGLLVTATHWRPAEMPRQLVHPCELDYDVAIEPKTFGTMTRLVVDNERVQLHDDARCFKVLHGLEAPCEGCPVHRSEAPWPRVSVRAIDNEAFEVKSADTIETGLVRIRSRTLSDHTLEAIHVAKIEQLADRAELSAREREVLTYLMLGRSIEDIASQIGIAARTVKFHQANVLQKLGADSRADLVRLLF